MYKKIAVLDVKLNICPDLLGSLEPLIEL